MHTLLAVLLALVPNSPAQADVPGTLPVQVTRAVDGDTIVVSAGDSTETIRIIGLNTPETVAPRRPVECYGPQASARARELLTDQTVYLARDPRQPARDRYRRLLAHVWLPNGELYAAAMIQDGFARELTVGRAHYFQGEYRALQAQAEATGRGLWSACPA
jgi:micrococcal nuclease